VNQVAIPQLLKVEDEVKDEFTLIIIKDKDEDEDKDEDKDEDEEGAKPFEPLTVVVIYVHQNLLKIFLLGPPSTHLTKPHRPFFKLDIPHSQNPQDT
jgi:hypothetical protein